MYSPRDPVKKIIDRAWEHIQSVPYKVSIRWVFYKLLQEGYFSKKSDYNRLKSYLSQARKRYYRDWRPDTLADETRQPIYRGLGYRDEKAVVDHLPDVAERIDTQISHFYRQSFYVEIWFEAKAMAGQFLHYSKGIILRPFGGDPSIPYKYRAAQELDYLRDYFGSLPVVILYFGDYDEKGLKILESAMEDIYQWSATNFEYRRCGLTLEQAEMFGIPENLDKPGEYQWEALVSMYLLYAASGSLKYSSKPSETLFHFSATNILQPTSTIKPFSTRLILTFWSTLRVIGACSTLWFLVSRLRRRLLFLHV